MVVVAHNSGGPKLDIIGRESELGEDKAEEEEEGAKIGYLASSVDEYALKLYEASILKDEEREELISASREHIQKFSDEEFVKKFKWSMSPLLEEIKQN